MTDPYLLRRQTIEKYFVPENLIDEPTPKSVSASGAFSLEVLTYRTQPGMWNYRLGRVTRVENGIILAEVKRNFSTFWHCWVDHPNGKEYLLCGEDYQGYSVIDLNEGNTHVCFPEAGYKGWGFCWAEVYPSPDGLILAVDGCQWGAPYDVIFFDFSQPELLPLPELGRISGVVDPVLGWVDPDTFVTTVLYDIRTTDGAKYNDLGPAEQDEVDADPARLLAEKTEQVSWHRPKSAT